MRLLLFAEAEGIRGLEWGLLIRSSLPERFFPFMTTFSDLGLSKPILRAVDALGYVEPTPVQEQAIPYVLEGRDIVAAAKTGTGKTAAFTLPALDGLPRGKKGAAPALLVVTPTRELATQIGEVATEVAKQTGHKVLTVVGGLSYGPQTDALRRGVDVLIATPGRLVDLMEQGAADLSHVQVLVLDEADRMLDMGFLPSVRKIVRATPQNRQTLLFSATIDDSVMGQVGNLLHDPAYVQIAHKGETADTVEQYVIPVSQAAKPDLLRALLEEKGGTRIIVFVRTRHRADTVSRRLKKAGISAAAIHSDRSQNQRKRALDSFAEGKTDVIVATDVLARGIDVDSVNYVVNYDIPHEPEDYIHRIGRTGRAGSTGWAVSFVSPDNTDDLKAIQRLIKRDIPEMQISSFNEAEALAKVQERQGAKRPQRASAQKHKGAQRSQKSEDQKRAGAKKEAKRPQKPSQKPKAKPKQKPKSGFTGGSGGRDMRPGRANRAAQRAADSRRGRK